MPATPLDRDPFNHLEPLHLAHTVMPSVQRDLYIELYVEEGLGISIRSRYPLGEPFIDESGKCIPL
jgi:hypothetical protein